MSVLGTVINPPLVIDPPPLPPLAAGTGKRAPLVLEQAIQRIVAARGQAVPSNGS